MSAMFVMAIMAFAVIASAQIEPAEPSSRQTSSSPTINITKTAGLYDIDAGSTDIEFVFEALARCSGANIVVSPDITGVVTAHLKQLSLESILDYLATVQGFAWEKSDDTYLVASKDRLQKPTPPVIEEGPPEPALLVWQCKYIKAYDVVTLIQALFPDIKVSEGPGSITPVLDGSVAGLGVGSGGTSSAYGSTSTGAQSGGTSPTGSRSIVLIGDPKQVGKAKEALLQLDVERPQVSIKVEILEISSSYGEELGVNWTYSDLVFSEAAPESAIKFGTISRAGMTLTGAISALLENGAAKLLAQPNIAVIDGECANILIGDRILFPKLIGYSQFGTPIYDKEEERVGISLQIASKVTTPEDVLMTLYPQVSLVTSYLKTQAGNYPQISTREAKTTVSVKSGDTLVIGGLLRDDEIKSASKIPLLGDLPIIGGFFRHTTTTKEHNEIVILLTPTVLESN